MDTKEKHNEEMRRLEKEVEREKNEEVGQPLLVEGKNRKNNGRAKSNKLWLWFGIIILIFILLYWLWTIGLFDDLTGFTNG